jgi:hypothetical protein
MSRKWKLAESNPVSNKTSVQYKVALFKLEGK